MLFIVAAIGAGLNTLAAGLGIAQTKRAGEAAVDATRAQGELQSGYYEGQLSILDKLQQQQQAEYAEAENKLKRNLTLMAVVALIIVTIIGVWQVFKIPVKK